MRATETRAAGGGGTGRTCFAAAALLVFLELCSAAVTASGVCTTGYTTVNATSGCIGEPTAIDWAAAACGLAPAPLLSQGSGWRRHEIRRARTSTRARAHCVRLVLCVAAHSLPTCWRGCAPTRAGVFVLRGETHGCASGRPPPIAPPPCWPPPPTRHSSTRRAAPLAPLRQSPACAPGYAGASACSACAKNKWSGGGNASAPKPAACTSCPAGRYTVAKGSTKPSDCICALGLGSGLFRAGFRARGACAEGGGCCGAARLRCGCLDQTPTCCAAIEARPASSGARRPARRGGRRVHGWTARTRLRGWRAWVWAWQTQAAFSPRPPAGPRAPPAPPGLRAPRPLAVTRARAPPPPPFPPAVLCSAGFFYDYSSSACAGCAKGTWSQGWTTTNLLATCTACPNLTTTGQANATGPDKCVCEWRCARRARAPQ